MIKGILSHHFVAAVVMTVLPFAVFSTGEFHTNEDGTIAMPAEGIRFEDRNITVGLYEFVEEETGVEVLKFGIRTDSRFYYLESRRDRGATKQLALATTPSQYALASPLGCGSFEEYLICESGVQGLNYSRLLFLFKYTADSVIYLDAAYFDASGLASAPPPAGIHLFGTLGSSAGWRAIRDLDGDGFADIMTKRVPIVIGVKANKLRVDLRPEKYSELCDSDSASSYELRDDFCAFIRGQLKPSELSANHRGDVRSKRIWLEDLEHWSRSTERGALLERFILKEEYALGRK